ncbi:MAG: ABC transporter ATP-binding protein [Bacteroidetes bacterium]|nr:MAG: ABC transporter ATP-binding protein [Bacteroidota bacterium]
MPTLPSNQRMAELRSLLNEGDLSRLSRRLLDFFADIPVTPEIRQAAIRLRAGYNRHASLEPDAQDPGTLADLRRQAHEVVEALATYLELQQPLTPQGDHSPDHSRVFSGHGISKTYQSGRNHFALPAVDLELRLGEITGIVGENGNGKTTLLRIVAGDLRASEGSLAYPYIEDPNVQGLDWYRIKQHIVFIPQQLAPWQGLLKENLHFSAAVHGIRGRENEELVDFMIHRLGLSRYADSRWSEISSGYRLRFELARALVRRPTLLLIDEPLANLDINTQEIFLQDLRYLANSSQYPLSIMVSSQHLHEIERIADHIVFIKNGETLYNGRIADFGADRQEDVFELATPWTKGQVEARLPAEAAARIEDRGHHLILRTPRGTGSQQVLTWLVQAGVPLNYFRDISTSTLKLFRE